MQYVSGLFSCLPNLSTQYNGYGQVDSSEDTDPILYRGMNVNIIVPDFPIAADALQIKSANLDETTLWRWGKESVNETQELINKILCIWKNKGISDYILYGKTLKTPIHSFAWEIIPYSPDIWPIGRDFNLEWNIAIGSRRLSPAAIEKIVKEYKPLLESDTSNIQPLISAESTEEHNSDTNYTESAVEKQCVFEGKEINIFYSAAPICIGKSESHLILAPKKRRQKFTELTSEEFLEAITLTQKLSGLYTALGIPTCYMFAKTGSHNGQKNTNWRLNLIFTSTKTETLIGKLEVFKAMTFGGTFITSTELTQRVENLRGVLKKLNTHES